MPLVPPGQAQPMPVSTEAPPIEGMAPPPPIPGQAASNLPPPPPPINSGIHEPPALDVDEPAVVTVLNAEPPPIPDSATIIEHQAQPAQEAPPPVQQAAPPPPPVQQAAPPPPVPAAVPAAPGTAIAAEAPPSNVPSTVAVGGGNAIKALEEEGFEGLNITFGSFPMMRLQDTNYSTNEGDSYGSEFLCVVHSSRVKWLYKKEDDNKSDDFVYSYDQLTTTTGKPIDEVTAEWEADGFENPVWKKYLDVTAQIVDPANRTLDKVVILSVPNNSVGRLTGYLTTLKLGRGVSPNEVITHVHLGQRVTSAAKPFYPWAFKFYSTVEQLLG